MANTPTRSPIEKRDDDELLKDLGIELRSVACGDYGLPNNPKTVASIGAVQAIATELSRRGIDTHSSIQELSAQTKWQMDVLLAECLRYPKVLPFVREADGIRRSLRCHLCSKNERPIDAKVFWFCRFCMQRVVEAVRTTSPIDGILLFRTYNTDNRCHHATHETVLAADSLYDSSVFGVCEVCILEELGRRETSVT
jgi:hypothetical protein